MDFFSKITPPNTVKLACVSIIAAVIFFISISMSTFLSYTPLKGVPPNSIYVIASFVSYPLAFLFIEIIIFIYRYFSKRHNRHKVIMREKEENQANNNKFREKFKATLPLLDDHKIELLTAILDGHKLKNIRKEPAAGLFKMEYISTVSKINKYDYILGLNPIIREPLQSYIFERRKEVLINFSNELDVYTKDFLRIFFEEKIPFGILEQNRKIEPKTYLTIEPKTYGSHYKMLQQKIITCENNIFTLQKDAEDKLINDNHFQKCFRQIVKIDTKFLRAPNSSGANRG